MDKFLSILGLFFKETPRYLWRLLLCLVRPRNFIKNFTPSWDVTINCVLLTACISACLDYVLNFNYFPSLVITEDGYTPLFESEKERLHIADSRFYFSMIGILLKSAEFAMLASLSTVAIMIMSGRLSFDVFEKYVGYLSIPIAVFVIGNLGSAFLMQRVIETIQIPGIIVSCLVLVFLIFVIQVVIVTPYLASREMSQIGRTKALVFVILLFTFSSIIELFFSPIDIYKSFYSPVKDRARIGAILQEVQKLQRRGEMTEAERILAELYRERSTEITVVLEYIAVLNLAYLDRSLKALKALKSESTAGQLSKDDREKILGARGKLVVALADAVHSKFPDIAAFQIFAGERYALIGECWSARTAFRTAFGAGQGLPLERVHAAKALRCLSEGEKEPDLDEYISAFDPKHGFSSLVRSSFAGGLVGANLMVGSILGGSATLARPDKPSRILFDLKVVCECEHSRRLHLGLLKQE